MDLPALIRARRARPGNSLREMEERTHAAVRAGTLDQSMSRSLISDYEHGRIASRPGPDRVEALAVALSCTFAEVAAAVEETYRLEPEKAPDARSAQRAEAWVRLTADRSEAEVEELLLIVEQVLRMRDLEDRPD